MAQYYADIQGSRGAATRMGTKNSGMGGHIRGWNVGARVWMGYNEETEQDECTVSITGGSNGGRFRDLGTFTAADLETEPEEVREASCILDEEVAGIIKGSTVEEQLTTYVHRDILVHVLADYFAAVAVSSSICCCQTIRANLY